MGGSEEEDGNGATGLDAAAAEADPAAAAAAAAAEEGEDGTAAGGDTKCGEPESADAAGCCDAGCAASAEGSRCRRSGSRFGAVAMHTWMRCTVTLRLSSTLAMMLAENDDI